MENIQGIAEGENFTFFYVWSNKYFVEPFTGLRNLTFKVAELNHFPIRPYKDRNLWKETVLWVHAQQRLRHPHENEVQGSRFQQG